MKTRSPQAGFSLIELIVVTVLLGLLASGAGLLIRNPIEAYDAQLRRQLLVDQGEMALRQIARDVRRALPNSLRTRTSAALSALEMINTVDGARYRDEFGAGFPSGVENVLDFTGTDNSFNLLGLLSNPSEFDSANRLVIYNTSNTDIYSEANELDDEGIITPAANTIGFVQVGTTPNIEHRITLSPPFRFTQQSPGQRVFFVDGSFSYVCDPANNQILRYAGYGFQTNQPIAQTDFGFIGATLVSSLSGCSFNYAAGTAQRGGNLTIEIAISDGGETINLLHQVHVRNVPRSRASVDSR